MNCTPSANNSWLTQAEPWTHWLIGFKPKSSSRIARDTKHDEQSDAPERPSQTD